MEDVGIDDDTWVSVTTAAKEARVDQRTIRRWADERRVRARVTPGGTRQISLQSLRSGFERETAARRSRNGLSADVERAAPDVAILYLARAADTWGGWKPRSIRTEAKCFALLEALRTLIPALEWVQGELEEEIRERGHQ